MTKLPPDPENMNGARATWAAKALRCFQHEAGADDEDALTDLLCDLMHWSDRNGDHFENALRLAELHYQAETTPEPAEDNGSAITFVRTTIARPEPTANDNPRWMQRIREFGSIEIQPHAVMRGSSCGDYLEPCDPQHAEVWTVNGRYLSGGVELCEDFATEAEAHAFRDRLISDYPHLAARTADNRPGASGEEETNGDMAR
jgi:hypothetical protein